MDIMEPDSVKPNFIDQKLQNVIDGVGRLSNKLELPTYTVHVERYTKKKPNLRSGLLYEVIIRTVRTDESISDYYKKQHSVWILYYANRTAVSINIKDNSWNPTLSVAMEFLINQSDEIAEWLLWNQLC